MSTPARPPRPIHRRLWVVIPVGLILLVVGAFTWAYVRGTVPDSTPSDPTSPDQRPRSQLFRDRDGHVQVRAAVLLDHPRQAVWKLVTDFPNYDQFLPYLRDIQAEPHGPGVTRM